MTAPTRAAQFTGRTLLSPKATEKERAEASHKLVKMLRGDETHEIEWDIIPVERDAIVQYEPVGKTLRATLHNMALYRLLVNKGFGPERIAPLMVH